MIPFKCGVYFQRALLCLTGEHDALALCCRPTDAGLVSRGRWFTVDPALGRHRVCAGFLQ